MAPVPDASVLPCKLHTPSPSPSRREGGGDILRKGGGRGDLPSKAKRRCGSYLWAEGGTKQFFLLGSLSGHCHVLMGSGEGSE